MNAAAKVVAQMAPYAKVGGFWWSSGDDEQQLLLLALPAPLSSDTSKKVGIMAL
jgi:hypothetical protein